MPGAAPFTRHPPDSGPTGGTPYAAVVAHQSEAGQRAGYPHARRVGTVISVSVCRPGKDGLVTASRAMVAGGGALFSAWLRKSSGAGAWVMAFPFPS